MNNLPSTLVEALAVKLANVPELMRQLILHAYIISNKIIFVLNVLDGESHHIGRGQYIKVGWC